MRNPVGAEESRSQVPLIVAEKGQEAFGLSNFWAKLKTARATEKVAMRPTGTTETTSWETRRFVVGPNNDEIQIPFIEGAKLRAIPGRYSETYAIDSTGTKVAATDTRMTDLWVIDLPTSHITKVTSDGVGGIIRSDVEQQLRRTNTEEGGSLIWATTPRWSPTGDWIAYSSNRTGSPGHAMYHAVMAVRSDGTDERILATPKSLNAQGPLSLLGWRQDGTVLVADVAAKTVHSVDLNGNSRAVVRDVQPPFALSTDGRYLAHKVQGKLAVADLENGDAVVQDLPSGMPASTTGVWSSDGTRYAVMAYAPAFSARDLKTRPVKLVVMDMTTRQVVVHTPSSGRLDITVPLQWLASDKVLAGTDQGIPWSISLGGGK